ncbi:MAG TPA: hypothetical protein VFN27_04210 [Xanthobacteraceae bacterium]|nr:hypothetical protein [Xanthobacteraceae bacterium]
MGARPRPSARQNTVASVGVSPPNLFFRSFPFVIAGQKARSAVFNLKAPAFHAEATLANASTGICLLQFSMDHRVKRGGDESETVACHSSGAKARRENEVAHL